MLALLASGLVQAGTGLFSDDDILNSGPLAHLVASQWVSLATWVHTTVNKAVLIALVLLHVAAILYYRLAKHRDLVRPMLTGDKELPSAVEPAQDGWGRRALALCLFFVLMSGVWWVAQSLGT